MFDNASEPYNQYLEIYFDEYKALSDIKKRKLSNKYDPINLFLETYNYYVWFENEESADTQEEIKKSLYLPDMAPVDDEEVKKEKGLKILTPKNH